jgi:glycerophosphoryl diester phosphodiesterase
LQCFDAAELRRVREELGSSLPLVQLVGRSSRPELLAAAGLERVAEYATALGPNYRQVLAVSHSDEPELTPLGTEARRAGLLLHPYTFNRDHIPAYAETLEKLLELAYDILQPDAVFCDYPDVAVRVRDHV